jgi:hypothetical protein
MWGSISAHSGVFESRISALSVLRHRVDQRRLAILDLRDCPLERRLKIRSG